MGSAEVLTSVVAPALGAVLANLLFLGPLPAVLRARQHATLGAINPVLFPWILINCVGYTSYGYVRNDLYIVLGNIGGIFLGIFYLLTSYRLTPSAQVTRRLEMLTIGLGLLWAVLDTAALRIQDRTAREALIAYPALVMSLCMFAAPLSNILHVVRKRDCASINRGFLVMQVLNCLMWSTYGVVTHDPTITTGNSIGLLLGLAQVGLVCVYPRLDEPVATPAEAAPPPPFPQAKSLGNTSFDLEASDLIAPPVLTQYQPPMPSALLPGGAVQSAAVIVGVAPEQASESSALPANAVSMLAQPEQTALVTPVTGAEQVADLAEQTAMPLLVEATPQPDPVVVVQPVHALLPAGPVAPPAPTSPDASLSPAIA